MLVLENVNKINVCLCVCVCVMFVGKGDSLPFCRWDGMVLQNLKKGMARY